MRNCQGRNVGAGKRGEKRKKITFQVGKVVIISSACIPRMTCQCRQNPGTGCNDLGCLRLYRALIMFMDLAQKVGNRSLKAYHHKTTFSTGVWWIPQR